MLEQRELELVSRELEQRELDRYLNTLIPVIGCTAEEIRSKTIKIKLNKKQTKNSSLI